jgi:hypothetical protein
MQEHKCKIWAAPARRQSSNGLVERTWQTIIRMARSYISEKQMGREYWFFAIKTAARMLNQVPGRVGRKLTSPFELIFGIKPDAKTWFEPFSIGYFPVASKSCEAASASEAQTMDGIAVMCDEKSNTIVFYNPITRAYYSPPSFKLDPTPLPVTLYPKHVRYDGGFVCGPLRNNSDPVPEPFPPGTRVQLYKDDVKIKGTIQNIPLPFAHVGTASDVVTSEEDPESPKNTYTVLLDDGTTTELLFEDLINPIVSPSEAPSPTLNPFNGLPYFLSNGSKVTLYHNGSFHKGFMHYSPDAGFQFVVKRNLWSTKIDFSVTLPNFKQTWSTLVGEDILIPGNSTVSNFLKPNSSNNQPSVKHVSAKNLLNPCPPSLIKALHPSNPIRDIWLKSYEEEKGGLQQLNVYEPINKKTYLQLRAVAVLEKLCRQCVSSLLSLTRMGNLVGPNPELLHLATTKTDISLSPSVTHRY